MNESSGKHGGGDQGIALLKTGVPGFDVTLGGGLPKNGLYLIQGLAGSGKTTLACQMGFLHARQGEKVLVLTLLAESHSKMMAHFGNFKFYDETLVGREIVFFSGFKSLVKGGLTALLQRIVEILSAEGQAA